MENYIKYIQVFIVAQFYLLCFILLIMKKNKPANLVFFSIIFFLALGLTGGLFRKNHMDSVLFFYNLVHIPSLSLFGPLVYWYTNDMIYQEDKRILRKRIHFMPSVISFLLNLFVHLAFYFKFKTINLDPKIMFSSKSPIKYIPIFLVGLSFLSALLYTLFSAYKIKKHSKKVKQFFSDIARVNLNWMNSFITVLFFVFLTGTLLVWSHILNLTGHEKLEFFIVPVALLQLMLVHISTYYIITQPDIFREIHEMESEIGDEPDDTEDNDAIVLENNKAKYEKQSIDDLRQKKYLDKLLKYMSDEKPYLRDSITLKELADSLNIPGHHLSIVINNKLNKNFYNFINEYRINEVLEILKDPENSNANILSVAFKSGFNSKSAFNNIFKKFVGLTPSEYRKKVS